MGLISRVSSRTYRTNFLKTMTSNGEPSAKKQKIDEILTLNLPFPDTETRDTVYRVMIADKNPKKSQVDRQMYKEGETSLRVEFSSTSLKSIRTASTSFFELYILCLKTIDRFSLDKIES